MSDIERLKRTLAKLGGSAEPADANGRKITADPKGLLAAILVEIDETILARTITFQRDDGDSFELEVANRRLHRLSSQSGESNPLLNEDFPDSSGPSIDALAQFLDTFLAGTSSLKVKSSRLSRAIDPSEIGCLAEALARNWSLNLLGDSSEGPGGRIEDFITACSVFAIAWAQLDAQEIIRNGGKEDELSGLVKLAKGGLSDLDKRLDVSFPEAKVSRCVVLGSRNGDRQSIVYARDGSNCALITIPSERLPDINACWRKSGE